MSKISLIRRSYIYNMIDMEQEYKLSGHWDFQELNWLITISQNIEIHVTVFISGCTGTNFAMVEKKCYQLVDIKIKSVKAYDCSPVSIKHLRFFQISTSVLFLFDSYANRFILICTNLSRSLNTLLGKSLLCCRDCKYSSYSATKASWRQSFFSRLTKPLGWHQNICFTSAND